MEDKSIAIDILADAGQCVGGGRNIHGDVAGSYEMAAEMFTVYMQHSIAKRHGGNIQFDANDVLELMSILKKVRHVYSPETNRENFVDDAGYVALAALVVGAARKTMLPRIQPPAEDSLEGEIRSFATKLRPSHA